MFRRRKFPSLVFLAAVILLAASLRADPVPARHKEGSLHAFLTVRDVNGKIIGNAEVTQLRNADHMVTRVVFRLKDGSRRDDTSTFSQRHDFRLISDHVVQKGPSFKPQMESTLDVPSGQFTAKYQDDDGKQKQLSQHLDLPADISNGLIWTLLKNVDPNAPTTVSLVSASPKPHIMKLHMTANGASEFSIAGTKRSATHFVLKTESTGTAKVIASLLGRHPPEVEAWVLEGKVPEVLKFRGPLSDGGPVWQIEPASPSGPKSSAE